jgi:3-dehydroquinate synthase
MKTVQIKLASETYNITVGHDLLKDCGNWVKKCLTANTKKIVIVSNQKVFGLYGEIVLNGLETVGFQCLVCLIGDGEKYKNFRTLEKILKFCGQQKISRTDAILALGGGVVGDLAGFAASIYLRGIAFLQIPTTLLAVVDSSVGGKTGINTEFGKNLVGAFHQPSGVLVDIQTLKTLPKRELTAGFCEVIKHGVIGGKDLFETTSDFLKQYPPAKFNKFFDLADFIRQSENLIAEQVAFKAKIVAGDEKEEISRDDSQSRKILNFGHTVGHALEKITDYRRFKHGEAVGYGMLVAAEISKNLDIFPKHELKSLNEVVHLAGKLPNAADLSHEAILNALSHDKKNIGNSLKWVLPETIGKPRIVDAKEISEQIIRKSLQTAFGEKLNGKRNNRINKQIS